jgi:hypothetical protein
MSGVCFHLCCVQVSARTEREIIAWDFPWKSFHILSLSDMNFGQGDYSTCRSHIQHCKTEDKRDISW